MIDGRPWIDQRHLSPLRDGVEHQTRAEYAGVSTCAFPAAAVMRCLHLGLPELA